MFRYDQFRAAYGDMLDPALEEEFKAMQQMGLPTMLVNSYGDMEEEEVEQIPLSTSLTVSSRVRVMMISINHTIMVDAIIIAIALSHHAENQWRRSSHYTAEKRT